MVKESQKKRGNLPLLSVKGESFSEAWENSIYELHKNGISYKRDDPEDNGLQTEACMAMEITNPDSDPFIHLFSGCTSGGEGLLDYFLEIFGARDSWRNNRENDYTYHGRLTDFPGSKVEEGKTVEIRINQLDFAVERLIERPFSRRSNIATWIPEIDTKMRHTPCLQSMWFEIINNTLNVNYRFRTRNVMNAAFSNMLGLYLIQCDVRDKVEEATGKNLYLHTIDFTDAYHISSRDHHLFESFPKNQIEAIKEERPRTLGREETIEWLREEKDSTERKIIGEIKRYCSPEKADEEIEKLRKNSDRIFYLLDKYAP